MSAARKPFDTERRFLLNNDLIWPLNTLRYNLYLVIEMAKKGTGKITITLDVETVRMLRAKKRGTEKWDDLMRRVGRRMSCGLECMMCGEWLETDETDVSLRELAEQHGWTGAYSGKLVVGGEGPQNWVKLGYICGRCGRREGRNR